MGSGNTKEGIVNYWLFQKKLEIYLKGNEYIKDSKKIKEGYLLDPKWISQWKKGINYNKI